MSTQRSLQSAPRKLWECHVDRRIHRLYFYAWFMNLLNSTSHLQGFCLRFLSVCTHARPPRDSPPRFGTSYLDQHPAGTHLQPRQDSSVTFAVPSGLQLQTVSSFSSYFRSAAGALTIVIAKDENEDRLQSKKVQKIPGKTRDPSHVQIPCHDARL